MTVRVLIVTSRLPYPPSWGAAARDYNLARQLAQRCDVTMLCPALPEEDAAVATLRHQIGDVRTLAYEPPGRLQLRRRAGQLGTLLSPRPYAMSGGRDRALQAAVDATCADDHFDVVQIESVRLDDLKLGGCAARVLDEHNIEFELLGRMADGERSPIRRGFNRLDGKKLRRTEIAAWRAADACLLTSEREEAVVRRLAPGTPTRTVPNGVDVDYFRPAAGGPQVDSIVFTGNLAYRPNIDAVHHLVEDVFPLVAARRPGCTLTIVGGGGEALRRLERPGVRFTGWVPDLREYVDPAAVVVAPLRMGGGTRLKILEAFACAKAVVSTTMGVEGIDAQAGRHLLVGDDPGTFAAHVVALLEDPARAAAIGSAAAELVRRRYSWAAAAGTLADFYGELLAVRPAVTARPGAPAA